MQYNLCVNMDQKNKPVISLNTKGVNQNNDSELESKTSTSEDSSELSLNKIHEGIPFFPASGDLGTSDSNGIDRESEKESNRCINLPDSKSKDDCKLLFDHNSSVLVQESICDSNIIVKAEVNYEFKAFSNLELDYSANETKNIFSLEKNFSPKNSLKLSENPALINVTNLTEKTKIFQESSHKIISKSKDCEKTIDTSKSIITKESHQDLSDLSTNKNISINDCESISKPEENILDNNNQNKHKILNDSLKELVIYAKLKDEIKENLSSSKEDLNVPYVEKVEPLLNDSDFKNNVDTHKPFSVCLSLENALAGIKEKEDLKIFGSETQQTDSNKLNIVTESNVAKIQSSTDNKEENIYKQKCEENKTVCKESENDGENHSRIENDVVEVMDTEIINCNEIELVNVNDNELQKGKEIDRIALDSKEERGSNDQVNDEIMCDVLQNDNEKCKDNKAQQSRNNKEDHTEELSFDDVFQVPVSSEEENVEGKIRRLDSRNIRDEDDEDVCIILDPVMPEQKNAFIKDKVENVNDAKKKISTPNIEKSLQKVMGKTSKVMNSPKSRPTRNAAKLAGNKIKSLVLNDMNFEEVSYSNKVRGKNELDLNVENSQRMCAQCREVKLWKFLMVQGNTNQYLCSEICSEAFAKNCQTDTDISDGEITSVDFERKCAECHKKVIGNDKCLYWETMDFCNEICLEKYQVKLGSNCANCNVTVFLSSLGKYCVRLGYDIKQFCSTICLEDYKKSLKVCSYCQKDISGGTEGFLAPVGVKGQFKDFCTQTCMEKYEKMNGSASLSEVIGECAVCSNKKPVKVEVELDDKTHKLCSKPCFAAFKFVNNITESQCDMCKKYYDRTKHGSYTIFYEENFRSFCCTICMNIYIHSNRKIVLCSWCKVKKYNFDMIKTSTAAGQSIMMCSLDCLSIYRLSMNSTSSQYVKCDYCLSFTQAQYHLTMSDGTAQNFCSCNCVMAFQSQCSRPSTNLVSAIEQLKSPILGGGSKRSSRRFQLESQCVPVISSVHSLAPSNDPSSSGLFPISEVEVNLVSQANSVTQSIPFNTLISNAPTPPQIYQQIITKPLPRKQMKNKSILCKPYCHTKGVSCRPHPCVKETQTDHSLNRKFLIPIPVPIYVPAPMHMFATPFPVPVPFPLPIPVPIFIPTTRNSAKGIMKEIKKIQEKIPTDPFEAELLMMAEMVAGDKKQDPTDSEGSEDGNDGDENGDGSFSPENVDANHTFGDDVLQMALKMASELEGPAVDMESVLTSNTITTNTQSAVDPNKSLYASGSDNPHQVHVLAINRGRKRSGRGSRSSSGGTPSKRGRRTSGSVDVPLLPPPEPVPPPRIEVEKPDANMCLKYTFGVNAWRHWVLQKNAELEKAAMTNRKIKLFKPELLQLTADELNFSLCLFVKEVRKPNGTEYAPDTIYYLCLGIQQYLFENGRIDNIFTDSYYEKFTDCLDEVAKKFAALYNDSHYIVTRVEEEHLWESKQLGAHSPHVLLSTLMFFNTKHFNLVTVEEHMQLSFSHIMKHWKRNPNTPGVAKVPGSRNVLLRFYPPQSALETNSRKKKVYEQQENEENPLRCPVKLYEFYLSKCPESVKTRNDVFYLLPERSCVPDSPVWYSTMALGKEPLMKMLHRVKMVKEINIALLSC